MSDAPPTLPTKSFLLSKTFWVQVISVLSLLIPQVKSWLDTNPEQVLAVFAALNVLVRFISNGKVSIFSGDKENSGSAGGLSPCVLGIACAAGLAVGGLPSCSPTTAQAWPITFRMAGPDWDVGYSAKSGLAVTGKIHPDK